MKNTIKNIVFGLASIMILTMPFSSLALTKDDVGLNVHWALGGFNKDSLYRQRLKESKTHWVREHFYNEVFYSEDGVVQDAWLERYDYVMEKYSQLDIRVVGMLAYGRDNGDFYQPNMDEWEDYVTMIVKRYKNNVSVWEVWNEPDSPTYLTPNNPETYIPLLKSAYKIIKKYDPDALVLNGGLAAPNADFTERLYTDADGYFDGLAFHVYTCRDSGHGALTQMLSNVDAVIQAHNPQERVWVTEMGCSTGSSGISDEWAVQYNQEVLDMLFAYPWMERAFIYTIRDRDDVDEYENNFGLLDVNMNPLLGWEWYDSILRGPYDKARISLTYETQKATELRRELEEYFGKGLIPVSEKNWPTLVNAYAYGEYSIQAIAQSIRFGGKTVHPDIPFTSWKEKEDYTSYIDKGWTGNMFIHAYGKPRTFITTEGQKASELMQILQRDYNFSQLRINNQNWQMLVNAYVYGGYPVEALARAALSDYKTVSPDIDWNAWKERPEYQQFITLQLPAKE